MRALFCVVLVGRHSPRARRPGSDLGEEGTCGLTDVNLEVNMRLMPYLRPFATVFHGPPACRMFALVHDNEQCPAEDFMTRLRREHPSEHRQLAVVLRKAHTLGPRNMHNTPVQARGRQRKRRVRVPGGNRVGPDPVVSRAAPHRRGVETIILVSGLRNKHVQQAAIDAAARSSGLSEPPLRASK